MCVCVLGPRTALNVHDIGGLTILGRVTVTKTLSRYVTVDALQEVVNATGHLTVHTLRYITAQVLRPKSAGVNQPLPLKKREIHLRVVASTLY